MSTTVEGRLEEPKSPYSVQVNTRLHTAVYSVPTHTCQDSAQSQSAVDKPIGNHFEILASFGFPSA